MLCIVHYKSCLDQSYEEPLADAFLACFFKIFSGYILLYYTVKNLREILEKKRYL